MALGAAPDIGRSTDWVATRLAIDDRRGGLTLPEGVRTLNPDKITWD
jgi:hypothetical protein